MGVVGIIEYAHSLVVTKFECRDESGGVGGCELSLGGGARQPGGHGLRALIAHSGGSGSQG
jgi:hypothetical protein